MTGPCNWDVSYAACANCAQLDAMDAPAKASVEAMATEFLWRWTGRRFGVCEVVWRPCRDCPGPSTFQGLGPATGSDSIASIRGTSWSAASGCRACEPSPCACTEPASIQLPGHAVAVSEVLIDGAVLAPAGYRLDGGWLVRADGSGWPAWQDLDLAADQPGTWQVTYTRGYAVPEGGKIAAGVLACELAKALCRDNTCQLPQRLQTITRQGVTMAMIDKFEGLDKGRTGIWLVDSWVASIVNPRRPGMVFSPDLPRRGRITPGSGV